MIDNDIPSSTKFAYVIRIIRLPHFPGIMMLDRLTLIQTLPGLHITLARRWTLILIFYISTSFVGADIVRTF